MSSRPGKCLKIIFFLGAQIMFWCSIIPSQSNKWMIVVGFIRFWTWTGDIYAFVTPVISEIILKMWYRLWSYLSTIHILDSTLSKQKVDEKVSLKWSYKLRIIQPFWIVLSRSQKLHCIAESHNSPVGFRKSSGSASEIRSILTDQWCHICMRAVRALRHAILCINDCADMV